MLSLFFSRSAFDYFDFIFFFFFVLSLVCYSQKFIIIFKVFFEIYSDFSSNRLKCIAVFCFCSFSFYFVPLLRQAGCTSNGDRDPKN